ncbi:MAG TPA: DEAD/DEAH box helicase [Thermoanaerobaculia bacterium]|jgi:superfamily II DNA or RNA helicase|nr:DEAD/DEAH box helicase [Thermoanaerobaculia bacterium]
MPPFTHLEFHRTGIGLVPAEPGQSDSAIYIAEVPGSTKHMRSCTCAASRKTTCQHLRDVSQAVLEVERFWKGTSWQDTFAASLWHRLARLLFEGNPQAAAKMRVLRTEAGTVRVISPSGEELAEYLDGSDAQLRFLERTGKVAGSGVFDRGGLLERLALFQATPQERTLQKAGMKTQRQSWEESFWYRLAYHCVRELEPGETGTFHPSIDESTGRFTLTFRRGEPMVRFTVPRKQVRAVLEVLTAAYPDQEDLPQRPLPLRTIFHISEQTDLDVVEVRPVIQSLQATGEERFLELAEVERFRYGSLIWLRDLKVLAELERDGKERKFRSPARVQLRRSQVPGFLEKHADDLAAGTLVLDEPLRQRRIFKTFDRVEIAGAPDLESALERSWLWLSIGYGFGNETVSLQRLLQARRDGLPYLEIAGGWIDLQAPVVRALDGLIEREGTTVNEDRLRLSVAALLRLQAAADAPVRLTSGEAETLDRLLHLRPAEPLQPLRGLATPLRPYQLAGAEWLRFLCENRLGGLLCDDMGLGKTLQTLALLVSLLEEGKASEPFLVVCPTSVLPHWRDQIRRHAPGLRPVIHHGAQRRPPTGLKKGDVLVTSYGVLRRDAEELSAIPFSVAVFDEVQQVKNRQTRSWQAVSHLVADIRLGLTGTPVENSLADLKALFDLVLPDYLGSDAEFEQRYIRDREADEEERRQELRRILSPFILRRLKSSVLDELPEKFEDLRTCALSEDQVKLYRDAIGGRGAELARQIEQSGDRPLPYIHIFALLNLLKQICGHPALALNCLDRAGEYASGKWDLFREVLGEAIESGQKVVVFTQFLGMIELMERHLQGLGVGYAVLTGSTVDRGGAVDRFNQDPECRVFLGSLKAGGTGIDLVGGSVVIHYDRWWNAAREDQATDRVHRLGQKRAVHVLKLIAEGTLEEKISALIDRKRRLMDSVIQEDDPRLAKIFTRDELLEMLRGDETV